MVFLLLSSILLSARLIIGKIKKNCTVTVLVPGVEVADYTNSMRVNGKKKLPKLFTGFQTVSVPSLLIFLAIIVVVLFWSWTH